MKVIDRARPSTQNYLWNAFLGVWLDRIQQFLPSGGSCITISLNNWHVPGLIFKWQGMPLKLDLEANELTYKQQTSVNEGQG